MKLAKKTTLGVQLYSIRDYCKTPRKTVNALRKLRKIGYQTVEIAGEISEMSHRELKELCADEGLGIVGYQSSIDELRNDYSNLLKRLKTYECQSCSICYLPEHERKTANDYKNRGRELSEFGKKLSKEGIILQYHNHMFEFQRFGGKYHGSGPLTGLDLLYSSSDPKYLYAELDTHWIARSGSDVLSWIKRMKGRMLQVHLKDIGVLDDQIIFAEIGEGFLDWENIINACNRSGVRDYIIEQDFCPVTKDPFKSLEISYRFLKKYL